MEPNEEIEAAAEAFTAGILLDDVRRAWKYAVRAVNYCENAGRKDHRFSEILVMLSQELEFLESTPELATNTTGSGSDDQRAEFNQFIDGLDWDIQHSVRLAMLSYVANSIPPAVFDEAMDLMRRSQPVQLNEVNRSYEAPDERSSNPKRRSDALPQRTRSEERR
jgi:hypothetical protein